MASETAIKVLAATSAIFGPGALIASETIKAAFDSPTFSDIKSTVNFTYKLAPSFGTLSGDAIKTMDAGLVTAISATIKQLENAASAAQASGKTMSWDDVVAVMSQSVALEQSPEQPVAAYQTYTYSPTGVFKFDGSADQNTVENIMAFYRNTINDEDVINASSITKDMVQQLANIVASTGAHVDDFETFFGRTDDVQRTLLDIGVLRFPDLDHPYFKVYRLQLHAWRHCKRVLFVEDNSNGLNIEFNSKKFVPRHSVLDALTAEVHEKALKQLEDLFG